MYPIQPRKKGFLKDINRKGQQPRAGNRENNSIEKLNGNQKKSPVNNLIDNSPKNEAIGSSSQVNEAISEVKNRRAGIYVGSPIKDMGKIFDQSPVNRIVT